MNARQIAHFLAAPILLASALQLTSSPMASAAGPPCPDVEAVFARGTGEEPGLGSTGQAFVDALRSRVGSKSVATYAVDYPASNDWPTGVDGIRDATAHIQATAAACPKTRMVLGGFSQGAAVMGFVTANTVPDGVDGADVPQPMPSGVADHVAAVTLFGTPNERAMNFLGQPQVVIGPLYAGKTIKLCATDDPVCSEGLDFAAHNLYAQDGLVGKGADYAASRV